MHACMHVRMYVCMYLQLVALDCTQRQSTIDRKGLSSPPLARKSESDHLGDGQPIQEAGSKQQHRHDCLLWRCSMCSLLLFGGPIGIGLKTPKIFNSSPRLQTLP